MVHTFPYSRADYFAFVAGVALLLTATHAFALWYSYRKGRRWLWLMGFLFACSAASLLEAVGVDASRLAAVPTLVSTSFALATALGIGYLAEAASGSRGRWSAIAPGGAFLVGAAPLLLAVVLAWRGWEPAHALIAMAFTLVVVLVSLDLLRFDAAAAGRGGLVAAAVGIGVWGVCQPVIGYAMVAGPRLLLGGWAVFGSATAALVAAVGMEPYLTKVAGGWGADGRVRVRRGLRAALIALLFMGLFGGMALTDFLGKTGAQLEVDALASQVSSMAAALSASNVQTLQGTPGDAQSGAYEELLDALDQAVGQEPEAQYLYLMRASAGRALILAEAVAGGGERSAPGTVFEDASPELLSALERGEPLIEGPVTDSFGTWYSALEPIVNHDTGAVVAHLGMDVPASTVDLGRQRYRLAGIALSLSMAVLIVGLYTVLQLTRAAAAITAESERRYRGLFESAPDGLLVAWADTHEIVSMNPRAEEWLGAGIGALAGQPLGRFLACDRPCAGSACPDCAVCPIEERTTLRGLDGRVLRVECSTLAAEQEGRPTIVVFVRDATSAVAAEESATARAAFNALIVDVSRRFVDATPDTIDTEIESALARIGAYANVDRAYIFEFRRDGTMSNTHEWVAAGVSRAIDQLQDVPLVEYHWVTSQVLARREVYIPDVGSARDLGEGERAALLASEIRSMLVVPVLVFGEVAGLLGFDSVKDNTDWPPDSIALLRIVAGMIGTTLHRTQTEAALNRAVGSGEGQLQVADA